MKVTVIDRLKKIVGKRSDECPHDERHVSAYQGVKRSVCPDCREVSVMAVGPSTIHPSPSLQGGPQPEADVETSIDDAVAAAIGEPQRA